MENVSAAPVGRPPVMAALRLGWSVAEVRGRTWVHGPRPHEIGMPAKPPSALPLRSERSHEAARGGAVSSMYAFARATGFAGCEEFVDEIGDALVPFDAPGSRLVSDPAAPGAVRHWSALAEALHEWDARIQDDLTLRDDLVANAYLLGRGMAECYWALGPAGDGHGEGRPNAASPEFLLGPHRRAELTLLLGRLGPELGHPLTPAAVAGSLMAWGEVVADPEWSRAPLLRTDLYEQGRRWYQLLVLQQDPTTLIQPYSRLSPRGLIGGARAFLPQLFLGGLALVLITAFFAVGWTSASEWVKSLLATGGLSSILIAGALARATGKAGQLGLRLRQDAYTDLVAASVTIVPDPPGADTRGSARRARQAVLAAVRRRSITPPTPGPEVRAVPPA